MKRLQRTPCGHNSSMHATTLVHPSGSTGSGRSSVVIGSATTIVAALEPNLCMLHRKVVSSACRSRLPKGIPCTSLQPCLLVLVPAGRLPGLSCCWSRMAWLTYNQVLTFLDSERLPLACALVAGAARAQMASPGHLGLRTSATTRV